jgi:alpha-N-arabinofuranosidase
MRETTLTVCKDFVTGPVDGRLFGSFVEHMGATVYNGIFQPGTAFADEDGFRRDVLALTRELGPTALRYPGGNFVSSFRWEDSVGPSRPQKLDYAWRAIEPNTFGLREFMHWAGKAGCEPILAVNLGTRDGEAAAALVEYCNFSQGGFYSDLRRAHGTADPFGVKTWCLGNELDGPWQMGQKTAGAYGRLAKEAGKMMRQVDPSIELIAVGSSTPRMETFPAWDLAVLMETYDTVDYLSLHHYIDRTLGLGPMSVAKVEAEARGRCGTGEYLARSLYVERQINAVITACDYVKSVKRSNKTLHLAFDEWNVVAQGKHPGFDHQDWQIGSPIDCGAHTLEDALAFAAMMMAIVRRADRIKIACQSLLVNTGPLIVAPKEGPAFRNLIFYPFMLMARYARGAVLGLAAQGPAYATESFSEVPVVDALAVYDQADEGLSLFLLNRSGEAAPVSLKLWGFNTPRVETALRLAHGSLDAANTAEAPLRVQPAPWADVTAGPEGVTAVLAPYSWNVARLKV